MNRASAVLLLIACVAVAQDITPHSWFGCADSRGANPFLRDTGLRFEPVTDPKQIAGIAKLPSKSLGRVRVHALIPPLDEEDRRDVETYDVTLYLVLDGRRYFALQPKKDDPFLLTVRNQRDLTHLNLIPAVPNRKVPLVVLSVATDDHGMGAGGYRDYQQLIDVSGPRPRPVAAIDCSQIQSHSSYCPGRHVDDPYANHEVACRWTPARQDFLCTQLTNKSWYWGDTQFKSRFYVRSTDPIWPKEVESTGPRTLQSWGTAMMSIPNASGQHRVLPRLGDTFVLDRPEGAGVLLAASRGGTNRLEPRFHLVTATRAEEIPVLALDSTASSIDSQPEFPGILDGPPMRFDVKRLPSPWGDTIFYEVLLTQQEHHSLFWVGVDLRHSQRSEALLLATDALDWSEFCPYGQIPASAAHAAWTGDASTLATLDVEPTRYLNFYCDGDCYATQLRDHFPAEEQAIPCAYDAVVLWSEDGGWIIGGTDRPCDTKNPPVRAIAISDSGELKASPVGVEKPPT